MSEKHLERKEVLNLVYTRQADKMADAYARLMADFSQMTAWGRGLESDLSWARAELMQVKAEVERMTKAGDAMAAHIERNDERCYIVLPDGDIRISEWNAAKEGNGQP